MSRERISSKIVLEDVVEENGVLRPLRPEDMLLDENVSVEGHLGYCTISCCERETGMEGELKKGGFLCTRGLSRVGC
jgi:hypothetical protein